MSRPLYTPSTMPVAPAPGPVLLFIRQAQMALVYRHGGGTTAEAPHQPMTDPL